jgi:hypothetical protein
MNVQHLLADDVPEDAKDRYSPVVCPALRLSGFARPISEDLSNLHATRAKQSPPA